MCMKMPQKEKNLRFLKSKAPRQGFRPLFLSFITLFSFSALAQESTGFVVDKIIVKVDNYVVLKSDLESAYQGYLTNGNPANNDAKCDILNGILINKLMVAKAEIDSIIVTDFEVDQNTDQRMSMILQNSGNSPEQLEKAYGKTLEEIKLELRDQIKEQLVGRQMQTVITKDISITPHEVRRFYSQIPADSLPYYNSDVEVAQIVRKAKVSDTQKTEARKKLMGLREQILKGADFNELAKKNSEDPSAQYNGGEMGYVGRGAMVPSFEAMAFKLKEGEIRTA